MTSTCWRPNVLLLQYSFFRQIFQLLGHEGRVMCYLEYSLNHTKGTTATNWLRFRRSVYRPLTQPLPGPWTPGLITCWSTEQVFLHRSWPLGNDVKFYWETSSSFSQSVECRRALMWVLTSPSVLLGTSLVWSTLPIRRHTIALLFQCIEFQARCVQTFVSGVVPVCFLEQARYYYLNADKLSHCIL
jgi:hypothetical protein